MTGVVSPADRNLYVLCAGGHARVVIDILNAQSRTPAGVVDADAALHGTNILGVPVVGADEFILTLDPNTVALVNALGNRPGQGSSGTARRRDLYSRFKNQGYSFFTVISDAATVSPNATLEEGSQVITRAVIQPGSVLGTNSILNTGASLDHDCTVGAHSHIAPWAVLCGGVSVGAECHIGARAVLVPGITVGDGAVVGAGAVVIDDVAAGATVVGNPAKVLKRSEE